MSSPKQSKTLCVIYTRFSPRRNSETCESCEVQQAYCEQFAAQKGWEVAAVFSDEAVSGSTEVGERNLDAAIRALKKGWVLLAHKRDRFARDLMIGLQVERMVETRGATCAVASGEIYGNDPNAQLMKHIIMAIAEWERKIIAERTRQAMLQHQRSGRRMSNLTPFGYRRDPKDDRRLVEDAGEQKTLARIMELHRKGVSNNAIAHALDPKSSRCGRWHTETVRHIIAREEKR